MAFSWFWNKEVLTLPVQTENGSPNHCKCIFFSHGHCTCEILMNKFHIRNRNSRSIIIEDCIYGQISCVEDFHSNNWISTCIEPSNNYYLEGKKIFTFLNLMLLEVELCDSLKIMHQSFFLDLFFNVGPHCCDLFLFIIISVIILYKKRY